MWVFDPGPKSILLFSPDGMLLRRIGRSGAGPGEFASTSGMAVLGDTGIATRYVAVRDQGQDTLP